MMYAVMYVYTRMQNIPLYSKSFRFLCNSVHSDLYYVTKPDPTRSQFKHRSRPAHISGTCYVSLHIDCLQMAAWQDEQSRILPEVSVGVTSFAAPNVLSHVILLKIMTVENLVFLLSSHFSNFKVLMLINNFRAHKLLKILKLVLLLLTVTPKRPRVRFCNVSCSQDIPKLITPSPSLPPPLIFYPFLKIVLFQVKYTDLPDHKGRFTGARALDGCEHD